jgi:hypothetical protein
VANFYSTDILDTIRKIREKWQNEPTIWDSGLLGVPSTDRRVPSEGDSDLPPVLPGFVTETTSFVFQAAHANIDIKSITPLSVEAADTDPTGETDPNMSEHGNWYYYIFDWRNYQNIMGAEAEAYDFNAPGGVKLYFRKLVLASLPYFARIHGKKMTINGQEVKKEDWLYHDTVQFGGYTVEARESPAMAYGFKDYTYDSEEDQVIKDAEKYDQHLKNVNPGLTFLIGVKRGAIRELDSDDTVEISMQDINPPRAIIMRHDSIDKDFDKIKSVLKLYHGIRGEYDTPFKVEPVPFDFKDEAGLIDDFKSALKELIKDSAERGGGSPNDDPEYMSDTEIEDWARYPALWDKPGNIIEIGVTDSWQVAYVREYAPASSFRAGVSIPSGIEAVRRLGGVENNRIIGGGFSKSVKQEFASFKDSKGVSAPRTVALISQMHASNGKNDGIKTAFNLDPEKGTPMLDIFQFINEYVLPQPGTSVSFQADDPEAYQRATGKFLDNHGGSIATPRQRSLAAARSNNPTWAKQYDNFTTNKLIIDKTDQFFASLPETVDRVRINEGPPYGLDEIWNNVLNRADIQRLTRELIKCAVDPQGWLELACRYAMKNLGVDAWFEEMQKDGTMDKLKASAEVANQVSDSFNVIAKEKRMSQTNFNRLNTERDKYNEEVLDLLNQRKQLRNKIYNASEQEKPQLRKQERQLNFAIEAAMGRRRQVELDSEIAYANKSVGAWMPMTPEGAARSAQASQRLSKAIMDVSDPNFKKQLCANIISYSKAAVQLLIDLYSMIEDLVNNPEETFTLEQENRPKAQTDNTGMYFEEAVRAAVAQALQATILFFVRKLLTELVESCLKIKANLWADLNRDDSRKNDKIPGKARYDDLLAQTPTKAARDLTQSLSGFIDVTDDKIVTDLLGLMEDLELLLSQLELCALSKGSATIETMKIVKNLLKIRYNDLYTNLKGEYKSLSFSKIKDFFRNFEPLIKAEYCEELQQSDPPLQLYQECPPYIETLCGDILIGHATNEQIDNICKRARMDRLDSLLEIIDFAYNEEKSNIPDPADPRSPNAVPQDMYPNNVYGDIVIDQNLRPSAEALKSEIFVFSNKLLSGTSTGVPDLKSDAITNVTKKIAKDHANSWPVLGGLGGSKWKGSANLDTDEINALIEAESEKEILQPLRDSLRWNPSTINYPFRWVPEEGDTISKFLIGKLGDKSPIYYELYDNDDNPQVLSLPLGTYHFDVRLDYILDGDASPKFLPIARYENFLNLYGETAPIIQGAELKHFNINDLVPINRGDLDSDFEDLFYSSKPAEDFYNLLNDSWPVLQDLELEGLANSKKEIKFLFNALFKNIGNELFNNVSKSDIFKKPGKEKLQLFFNNFFPQLAYPADVRCDIRESSLLKSENIKKYVKDRKKQLDKDKKQPDLNEETSNLGRSKAEAMVMALMRTYAFEMSLRVLPLLSFIKSKTLLTSEVLINIMIENILYESAMIDYKKVHRTLSGKQAEDLRSSKPVRGNMFDASGGKLVDFSISSNGNGRYVEEPCAPITGHAGQVFAPKFQAHITYYANNIVNAMAQKELEKGKTLLDPTTNEEYQQSTDPYSVKGINFLLKQQLNEISDFFEREFESLFLETNIKSFEQYFLEIFLYRDSVENIFDLMPKISDLEDIYGFGDNEPVMWFSPARFYELNGNLTSVGEKFLNAGGLILEPYIRVKQHKAFEKSTVIADEDIKKGIAEKAYKDTLKDYIDNAAQKQAALVDKNCVDPDQDAFLPGQVPYEECQQDIIKNWPLTVQEAAQEAYDKVINNEYKVEGEFNELFGDLTKGNGAYININQWIASMSGNKDGDKFEGNPILDPLMLSLNPDFAKKPHTDWFDPWMYGLRLTYVAPLEPTSTKQKQYFGEIATEITTDSEEDTYTISKEDVLKDFLLYKDLSKTVDDDPLDVYNKKTYILNEKYVNVLGDWEATDSMYAVPLIEVEAEVGSVTTGEKNYVYKVAYDDAYKKAKAQGKSDGEAENEAEMISQNLLEQLDSSVGLNYFTYQNWETMNQDEIQDDYPIDKLLCRMIKTPEFKKIFVEMFSVENYKTLLASFVLLKSFELNEYKEERNGNYVALFEYTKSQLRHAFYSNTMAHDPMTNIPLDPSEAAAAKLNEEGLDWWDKLGATLLGNPANYANIFALTPIGILKGMVTATDPTWGGMPWTVPGAVMYILQNMIPGLSGPWFSDNFNQSERQTPDALDCPDAFKPKSLINYSDEELAFLEMMKSYELPDADAAYILNTEYWLPLEDDLYIQIV